MKLKLIEKKAQAGDAISFYFKPKKKISWQAGQYLFYTLPTNKPDNRGVTRYFTISSSPSENHIAITTRINDKNSTFKKTLVKLRISDEIEASGPDGDFVVDNPKRNLIFIAGGIGITPFHSILLDFDHKDIKPNVQLLYANRDKNIVFKDELDVLTSAIPNLQIRYFISPTHIEESDIKELLSESKNPLIYISGPTPFVRIIRDIVKTQGIEKENIKMDYFSGYEN